MDRGDYCMSCFLPSQRLFECLFYHVTRTCTELINHEYTYTGTSLLRKQGYGKGSETTGGQAGHKEKQRQRRKGTLGELESVRRLEVLWMLTKVSQGQGSWQVREMKVRRAPDPAHACGCVHSAEHRGQHTAGAHGVFSAGLSLAGRSSGGEGRAE